jgi:hypothetical protein
MRSRKKGQGTILAPFLFLQSYLDRNFVVVHEREYLVIAGILASRSELAAAERTNFSFGALTSPTSSVS